ncbi:hypothetical protein [Acholeplasma granularum]|uniref:hypothetical protein n=1 Tax=Acholeplasma granularum TaxID=264635 RepID=UPI00046E57E2|nr:hypothetical protein [Acholeplasma granularum]
MDLTNGFKLLEFSTYGILEWAFVALIALLILILVIILFKKTKSKNVVHKNASKTNQKQLVYKSNNGETLIFKHGSAWHMNQDGLTENYKAIDGPSTKLDGKVVFASKSIRKVSIIQDRNEIIKRSANEVQYITLDFVSPDEVRLGKNVYLTQKGFNDKEKRELKQAEAEQKSQALADKKAEAIQKKADKRMKKAELKALKQQEKNNEEE